MMQLPFPGAPPVIMLDPDLVTLAKLFLFAGIVYFTIEVLDTFAWWIKEGRR